MNVCISLDASKLLYRGLHAYIQHYIKINVISAGCQNGSFLNMNWYIKVDLKGMRLYKDEQQMFLRHITCVCMPVCLLNDMYVKWFCSVTSHSNVVFIKQ